MFIKFRDHVTHWVNGHKLFVLLFILKKDSKKRKFKFDDVIEQRGEDKLNKAKRRWTASNNVAGDLAI